MEYYEELSYWYKNGYAYKLNGDSSCKLMKDLRESFDNTDRKGTFLFSHSEAVLPFITLLGLYEDNFKLTHDTFDQTRLYRTSLIGAFANNVGFVLFECEGQGKDSPKTHKILALHQEQSVKLPNCASKECDWEEFIATYEVKW